MSPTNNGASNWGVHRRGRTARPKLTDLDRTNADRRRAGLRRLLSLKQLNPSDLARKIGLRTPNALFNFLGGRSTALALETIERILVAHPDVSFADLVGLPSTIVNGAEVIDVVTPPDEGVIVSIEVCSGLWRPQFELPAAEWSSVQLPAGTVDAGQLLFGARVRPPGGELIYPAGSTLICRRLEASDNAWVPGCRYIVQRSRGLMTEVTVKELRVYDGQAWLWPCSTAPGHQQPILLETNEHFLPGDQPGHAAMALVGVVVASLQLENIPPAT